MGPRLATQHPPRVGESKDMTTTMLIRYLAFIVAVLALSGCERTPTGRSQLALVPDQAMAEMGERAFARMRDSQPVSKDPVAREQVQCVAGEIVAAAGRVYPDADYPESWEVVVFEDASPNAFALPGGHIGVHSGMLKVAENPAQLAAIIGHEVGHVLADHGNERMTQELGIKVALMLVGLFAEVESGALLQVLGLGAQVGIALPFSREHEREADLMGLRLMAAAGFPPDQSVALWRNMAELGSEQPIEFLSTHPADASRIRNLQAHLDAARPLFEQAARARCGS